MKRKIICPICGKEFETGKNAEKYCSDECRKKSRRYVKSSELKTLKCNWCGMSFKSERKKKYCSESCRMCANGRFSHLNKNKPVKPKLTLSQVAFLSRQAGLSYGEYVTKYRLA